MGIKNKLYTIKGYRNDIHRKLREVNEDTPRVLSLDKFADYIIPCEGDNNPSPSSLYFDMNYLAGTFMVPVKNFTGTIDWGDGTFEEHTAADFISHTYEKDIYDGDRFIVMTGSADSLNTYTKMTEENHRPISDFAMQVSIINFGTFKIKSMEGFMYGMGSGNVKLIGMPNTDSFEGMYRNDRVKELFSPVIFPKGMYTESTFEEEVKLSEGADILGANLFEKAEFQKGIELPDSIGYIGANAFKGALMKSYSHSGEVNIIIPNNTFIGNNAFDGIKNYDLVYFGEGCMVGDEAFKGLKLQVLQIPEGTKLGKGVYAEGKFEAFFGYGDITEIPERTFERATFTSGNAMLIIPKTINKIGSKAFAYAKFKQIKVPKSVEVAEDAFEGISKDKIIYED